MDYVGLEEPPSQRKVHYLKMKDPLFKNEVGYLLKQKVCYNYTLYRDVGIGPADSAAARVKFHPQLKIVVIN